ncbi:TPA: hypothetical protein N2N40_002557 [Citrobacter freundii]|nr:hypothetical protein [Citrobacter freundii]
MTDRVVYLNLSGIDETPFITEVEMLTGGVARLLYPDGTQQFVDDEEDPIHIFSPRLTESELEKFCMDNIERYREFHHANMSKLLRCERATMVQFWESP